MYCAKCGNKLKDTDVFCPACGTKVDRNDSHDEEPAKENESTAKENEPEAPANEPDMKDGIEAEDLSTTSEVPSGIDMEREREICRKNHPKMFAIADKFGEEITDDIILKQNEYDRTGKQEDVSYTSKFKDNLKSNIKNNPEYANLFGPRFKHFCIALVLAAIGFGIWYLPEGLDIDSDAVHTICTCIGIFILVIAAMWASFAKDICPKCHKFGAMKFDHEEDLGLAYSKYDNSRDCLVHYHRIAKVYKCKFCGHTYADEETVAIG